MGWNIFIFLDFNFFWIWILTLILGVRGLTGVMGSRIVKNLSVTTTTTTITTTTTTTCAEAEPSKLKYFTIKLFFATLDRSQRPCLVWWFGSIFNNRNMNMNGRMFYDDHSRWSPLELEDQKNILRTVEGIVLAKLVSKVQCSTFYQDYFSRDFYWTDEADSPTILFNKNWMRHN